MRLLGVDVAVRWADMLVERIVGQEKAAHWASDMEASLETRGQCIFGSPYMPRRTHIGGTPRAVRTSYVPSSGGRPTGATAPQRATQAR